MTIRVQTYDQSGAPVDIWGGLVGLEYSIGPNGPEVGQAEHARMVDGSYNPAVHHGRLMPGGRGAYVEVSDSEGIVPPFLGRAVTAPSSSGGNTVPIALEGPHRWMGRAPAPVGASHDGSPGALVADMVASVGVDLRTRLGQIDQGPSVPLELDGGSVWELLLALEASTGEQAVLTPLAGECLVILDWRSLSTRVQAPSAATLIDGVNCEADLSNDLDPDGSSLVSSGLALSGGVGGNTSTVRAPSAVPLGRLPALVAGLSSAAGQQMAGTSGIDASLLNAAGLAGVDAAAMEVLRRGRAPVIIANVRVTDEALWPALRPGALVDCRFDDPLGLWQRCIGEVQQLSVGLIPDRTLDIVVELWSLEG